MGRELAARGEDRRARRVPGGLPVPAPLEHQPVGPAGGELGLEHVLVERRALLARQAPQRHEHRPAGRLGELASLVDVGAPDDLLEGLGELARGGEHLRPGDAVRGEGEGESGEQRDVHVEPPVGVRSNAAGGAFPFGK